ncbi:MAG: cytidine deaminase [Caldilineaceae bacterium]
MNTKLSEAIQLCPAEIQPLLTEIVQTVDFCGVIYAEAVQSLLNTLGSDYDQLMLALLPLAKSYAVPPISHFYVGAVCRGGSGNLYLGGNMEFPGQTLGATIHAEQAAITHAWLHEEESVEAIAINGTPCGHCRQFMNELAGASQLRIITPRLGKLLLPELLPGAFGPDSLQNPTGWLHPVDHGLRLAEAAIDALATAALAQANRSYAPYSANYAGAAVQTTDGAIFAAPYAENAAFNPSLSPLQGALLHLHLAGKSFNDIQQAVLVESAQSLCSQADATRALLASVCAAPLRYYRTKE